MLLQILERDLKILLSERRTLLVIIAMPIILTSILSFALAGAFSSSPAIRQISIGVVREYEPGTGLETFEQQLSGNIFANMLPKDLVEEQLEQAAELDIDKLFFQDFLGDKDLQDIMTYSIMTEEGARAALEKGKLAAVVILPENFESGTYTNLLTTFKSRVEVHILRNPDMNLSSGIASSIIDAFLTQLSDQSNAKNILIQTAISHDATDRVGEAIEIIVEGAKEQSLSEIAVESVDGNEPIDSKTYYSIAMMTLFLLFSAGRGSYLLLTEKQNYTWHRMRAAGVNKYTILAGKYFVVFGLAVAQIAVLVAYSTFVLGVEWGDPLSVAVVTLFTAMAIAALGTFFASLTFLSENTRIANLMESVVFQVLGLLGGAYIPVEVLPKAMQALSSFPLNGVALKAYLHITTGGTLAEGTTYLLILTGNAVVFLAGSMWIMKQEGGGTHVDHYQAETAVS